MRTNSKGDILVPIEFQIAVNPLAVRSDFKIKATSMFIDSRDGALMNLGLKSTDPVPLDRMVANGSLMVEEIDNVVNFFAKVYDLIDSCNVVTVVEEVRSAGDYRRTTRIVRYKYR